MSFKIFSDTSCNIPMSRLSDAGVDLIPFSFYDKENINDVKNCIDIDSFDGVSFYDSIRQGKVFNTSQITPQIYYDYMEPVAREGIDILYVGMSSGISGSYNSSLAAMKMLEEEYHNVKYYFHDTKAASLGEGIAVFKAIELREKGYSIEETYNYLENMAKNIYQVFTVDDLKSLSRTGRLSNAVAIIGNLLNIKPLLKGNENGQIVSFDKVRGSKKAMYALAAKYNELVVNPENQIVGIAHANNPEDTQLLIDLINKDNPPKEILSVCYEPVTGSHVGPGTVALFFLGDDNVRFN